jgi:SAM-dependent methyltransferase
MNASNRSPDELRFHYEIEKELADRLRHARRDERAELYGKAYDELFQRVPAHPQLTRKVDESSRAAAVVERLALLRRFLNDSSVFLEIGAGDCALSQRVAGLVKKSIALDVSREILDRASYPNMEVVLSDGCSVPVVAGSVTIAYSYQVIEHIHPDDSMEQLRNIYRALAPGGRYLCVTPNRLNGPHDISRYFDQVASGLHLKEYTLAELDDLFRSVGFSETEAYVGFSHHYARVPVALLKTFEGLLGLFPYPLRYWLGTRRGLQNLLFVSLVGIK